MVTYTFTNGTVADADEVNQNFEDVEDGQGLIHRKVYDVATSDTSSTSWADSIHTFTLSAPTNSLVLAVYVSMDIQESDGSYNNQANVEFSGSNLGSVFLVKGYIRRHNTSGDTDDTMGARWETAEEYLFEKQGSSVTTHSVMAGAPLKILDDTTTVTVRHKKSNAGTTGTISNVHIEIVYAKSFTED